MKILKRKLQRMMSSPRSATGKSEIPRGDPSWTRECHFCRKRLRFHNHVGRREIYFDRNSVLGDKFDTLMVGTEVRFVEEEGDKGPRVSTLQPVAQMMLQRTS
jgi:cold shock CspA family protein